MYKNTLIYSSQSIGFKVKKRFILFILCILDMLFYKTYISIKNVYY